MQLKERFNADWYQKRIQDNRKVKQHLIAKIREHATLEFPFDFDELTHLNYEDLLEIAVATVNKQVKITLGEGSDLSNGADCKFSIARVHNYGRSYSSGVKCKNKKFVYACVYERIQDRFYYFAFPTEFKEHSIPFNLYTGEPKRYGRGGKNIMWTWECESFEQMACTNTHMQVKPTKAKNLFAELFD